MQTFTPPKLLGHQVLSTPLTTVDALPFARTDIELSAPSAQLEVSNEVAETRKVLALVRLHDQPLGALVLDVSHDRSWPTHSATVWAALRTRVNRHLSADGLAHSDNLESLATAPDSIPWCIRQRSAVLNEPPKITVIVATRERPGALRVCLESLLRQEYPRFEVVVVDNDPDTIETTKLIATRFYPRVQYVREPRRGTTWAYQRGLQAARGNIAAFVDDNVVVDKSWLTGIAEGFASAANVGCVTGPVLPASLKRQAQLAFEHDGFLEGGFTQRIFDNDRTQPGNRLFAFAAGRFGHAMNAGFDTALLRRLGGVDPTCGTERFARGGRDLSAFFRVVLEHRVVYQPAAIVWSSTPV